MIKTNKVFQDFLACFDNVYFISFLHSCRTAPFMMSKRITGVSLAMLSSDVVTKALSGPKRHI